MEKTGLYLVPTPVGNLEDITLRAIRILKEADTILAEDTRVSGNLMRHLGIDKRLQSYHMHNEHKIVSEIVNRIASGETIALVTDAGTPGISDPGFLLVRECIRHKIKVETLPGATAFVPALVNSGLPADRFTFEGFLPVKKGRATRLEKLREEERTMIFYESPYRLVKTLDQLMTVMGAERLASVSREISKMFEENYHGTLLQCKDHFNSKTVKGEIVIVVAGKNHKPDADYNSSEIEDNE